MLAPQAQKRAVQLTFTPAAQPIQSIQSILATLPESRLRQVLFNLIKNGIEASPQGREVPATRACTGESLALAVIYQRSGISAAIRTQIFEPFFSTRKEETQSVWVSGFLSPTAWYRLWRAS